MNSLCVGENGCGILKPVSEFYYNGDYIFNTCRECISKANKAKRVIKERYKACHSCGLRVKTSYAYLHFDLNSRNEFLAHCNDDGCRLKYNRMRKLKYVGADVERTPRNVRLFKLRARFKLWIINKGEFK